ncbi:DUF5605 domain-containing protein [Tessaracoccus rhinocerotis]|uniref:DUF5605 domain-containing protein n=1 Tax=Tessaracoccus rhinocerotis TaxID=1689449 RepID=UPI001C8F8C1E|nr:DUF5605 domain-containing protein [Tessaracoccus rhinocerotis]
MLASAAPELENSPTLQQWSAFPVEWVLGLALGEHDSRIPTIMDRLAKIEDTTPTEPDEAAPGCRPDYEGDDVAAGSAILHLPSGAELHRMAEVVLEGPSHGNPFTDVELHSDFTQGHTTITVGGFYDGEGRYVIRFLAPTTGDWTFSTRSNARSLDGVVGSFSVAASERPGPVRVSDKFHFAHANGQPFRPVGTTAYAWTHQGDELADETLRSLAAAPFNKVRMGIFPKDFIYNSNEPLNFAWSRREEGTFDFTRFDPSYWQDLERRIQQLEGLGIQADLILFHPYDRWGFATRSAAIDERYLRYLTRRLSAFPNVWWSLANEYDLLHSKTDADWDRIAAIIAEEDHVGHLLSIHNWTYLWDYSSPWATHCSLQYGELLGKKVGQWRHRWGKPVVVDEFGYEGDLDQGWGNLTAEAVTQQFWETTLAGGYATHGETFWNPEEIIFWAKGGSLRGEAPARIRFLSEICEASPTGRIEPLPGPFDALVGGVADQYEVHYFGQHRPLFRDLVIPEGRSSRIDVIDTWAMSITAVPGEHTGKVRVDLPARPWMAIRLTTID